MSHSLLQPLPLQRLTDALAVRAKRATDEDSNWLLRVLYKEIAVAIPKPRGLGKGWREDSNGLINMRREEIAVAASAVATQEATDEDSNWLPQRTVNGTAVAIRKQAELANGYRIRTARRLANGYRRG